MSTFSARLCVIGLAVTIGLSASPGLVSTAAAQVDRVAVPEGAWTVIIDESGPVAQWPGFEDRLLGRQIDLTGEFRAWESPQLTRVVTMIVDGPDGDAAGFVEGFLDSAADTGLSPDCAGLERQNVTVWCGEIDGMRMVMTVWQSNDTGVSLNTFGLTSAESLEIVDAQLALVPATGVPVATTTPVRTAVESVSVDPNSISTTTDSSDVVSALIGAAVLGCVLGGGIWAFKKRSGGSHGPGPTTAPPAYTPPHAVQPPHPVQPSHPVPPPPGPPAPPRAEPPTVF